MNVTSHYISIALVPVLALSPLVGAEMPANSLAPSETDAPATLQVRLLDSDGTRALVNSRPSKGIAVLVTDTNGQAVSDAAVAFRFPDAGSSAAFRDGTHSAVAYTDASGTARVNDFQWNDKPGQLALRVTASKANSHAGLLVEETLLTGEAALAASAPPQTIPIPAEVPPAPVVASATIESVPAAASLATTAQAPAPPSEVALSRPGVSMPSFESEAGTNSYRAARLGVAPAISISSTDRNASYSSGGSKKKWIILAIVAGAGAGVAVALMNHKSSASTTSTSTVAVGAPSITIGHP